MDKKLKALAAELAKGLETKVDLHQFFRILPQLTVKTALNAELTEHLDYEKMLKNSLRIPVITILLNAAVQQWQNRTKYATWP